MLGTKETDDGKKQLDWTQFPGKLRIKVTTFVESCVSTWEEGGAPYRRVHVCGVV